MSTSASRRYRTSGSVSIESVLVIPLFLVTLFAILQGSLWVYAGSVAQAAAQDGVRAGTVWGGTAADGVALAQSVLHARDSGTDWTVTATPAATTLTVAVTGHCLSIVPGLELTVYESATLPWERP